MNTEKISSKEEAIKLNEKLKEASAAYYQEDREIMSNFEFDKLYDMILDYEKENGKLPNSITSLVGHQLLSELETSKHEHKALSLNKTKLIEDLIKWLVDKKGCLSWKLDGLTVVATYDGGKLTKAVTRGDGETGEVITHNAKFFKGLPNKIKYNGHLVVRGESMISYSEFERINSEIEDVDEKYENPRNLASGTIRQLDSKKSSEREVCFNAFELVMSDDKLPSNSFFECLDWLKGQGFDVVEHEMIDKDNIESVIKKFGDKIEDLDFPSDGLVIMLDDIKYGKSLGNTEKFPRNGMAFKWADELKETEIIDIKWQPSRTGLINPVVVYKPVRLEGTTISNATGNNLSIMKEKGIAIGSKIMVYKANKIIPTIDRVTEKKGSLVIPEFCPICNAKTVVKISEKGTETLNCPNANCLAKNIKIFTHFSSRKAMNIKGFSDATAEKFIGAGYINCFADLYKLSSHKDEIVQMEGFGNKSYERLQKAIEKSRDVELSNFIYALGIFNVGTDASNKIAAKCNNDYETFLKMLSEKYDFTQIDGIGEVIVASLYNWYDTLKDKDVKAQLDELASFMRFKKPAAPVVTGNKLSGLKFVVHGTFEDFANKKEIEEFIKSNGGTIVGSVSNATSYVLSDDVNAKSGKTDKARNLGIPIITGKELINLTK